MPGYNVVDSLRLELKLLELGLYRAPTPARPLLIFQDSPTCLRYGDAPCPNCALTQFVPSECRSEVAPCQRIQLNDARETVDSLYRTGTQEELEETVGEWLKATIRRLESQQPQRGDRSDVETSARELAA
jgi:hypothetical protein